MCDHAGTPASNGTGKECSRFSPLADALLETQVTELSARQLQRQIPRPEVKGGDAEEAVVQCWHTSQTRALGDTLSQTGNRQPDPVHPPHEKDVMPYPDSEIGRTGTILNGRARRWHGG